MSEPTPDEMTLIVNGWTVKAVQRGQAGDSWLLIAPDGLRISFLQSEAVKRAEATGQWLGYEVLSMPGVFTARRHEGGRMQEHHAGTLDELARIVREYESKQQSHGATGTDG